MNIAVRQPSRSSDLDASAWMKTLSRYRQPEVRRSTFELLVTALPFAMLWGLAYLCITHEIWMGLVLVVPAAAAFLLRLFTIQHDCGHGSFFGRRSLDDWTGRILGVLTLTPYDYWRRAHAVHHASAGNLDERGIGDITTLTVAEYHTLSRVRRLGYRLYRHPLVMFGLGPIWVFLLKQRLPFGMMRSGALPWVSTMATNLAVTLLVIISAWVIGIGPFLAIHLPIVLLAGAAGVWLFYVQHQFEETHWAKEEKWHFSGAALHGASHYDLPLVLRWLTGNIGIHHVHHLSSRIPFYRLPEVLQQHPELAAIGRVSLRDSVGCVRLVLWDEERARLVRFRDVRRRGA